MRLPRGNAARQIACQPTKALWLAAYTGSCRMERVSCLRCAPKRRRMAAPSHLRQHSQPWGAQRLTVPRVQGEACWWDHQDLHFYLQSTLVSVQVCAPHLGFTVFSHCLQVIGGPNYPSRCLQWVQRAVWLISRVMQSLWSIPGRTSQPWRWIWSPLCTPFPVCQDQAVLARVWNSWTGTFSQRCLLLCMDSERHKNVNLQYMWGRQACSLIRIYDCGLSILDSFQFYLYPILQTVYSVEALIKAILTLGATSHCHADRWARRCSAIMMACTLSSTSCRLCSSRAGLSWSTRE